MIKQKPLELSCAARLRLKLKCLDVAGRLLRSSVTYSGEYETWKAAQAAATGYEQQNILQRVAAATDKVVRGEAAFERDSVVFAEQEYVFPLLAALLRAAVDADRRPLAVIDFGGALGSSYFQCRSFFPLDWKFNWCVVEQEHYVIEGRKRFESEELHFCSSMREATASGKPHLVLLSSVLQYLESPEWILDECYESGACFMYIDRTALSAEERDSYTVQRVPASIYRASYPCRILSRARLVKHLDPCWEILSEFPSADGWAVAGRRYFRFGGMFLRRKP